jgi:hypothetical protein
LFHAFSLLASSLYTYRKPLRAPIPSNIIPIKKAKWNQNKRRSGCNAVNSSEAPPQIENFIF